MKGGARQEKHRPACSWEVEVEVEVEVVVNIRMGTAVSVEESKSIFWGVIRSAWGLLNILVCS